MFVCFFAVKCLCASLLYHSVCPVVDTLRHVFLWLKLSLYCTLIGMDVAEVLGNNAAQALGFQLFAPVDANISTGGSPLGKCYSLLMFMCSGTAYTRCVCSSTILIHDCFGCQPLRRILLCVLLHVFIQISFLIIFSLCFSC